MIELIINGYDYIDSEKTDVLDHVWDYLPSWDGAWRRLRLLLAAMVFIMAIISVYFALTLAPVVSGGRLTSPPASWFVAYRRPSGPVPY